VLRRRITKPNDWGFQHIVRFEDCVSRDPAPDASANANAYGLTRPTTTDSDGFELPFA
jgi:hypothetical protein